MSFIMNETHSRQKVESVRMGIEMGMGMEVEVGLGGGADRGIRE